ncbi:DNA-binding transcriptional regulator, CsgD family [Sulfitobacter brevis]|uniref:DNA-binding transcriptional regulator, CsgD family n=1 Tax=Sulfitobacter brevis TaxID=74348 RepID=A0A1I2BG73_9RHOB|nr:helix-turn-helix transcriptional regulator [Sulfitobacter brevis]SFE55174.1 DNA-binding transcriptional regulator, CsgD family [Sulfitobacter brevis]
MTVPPLPALTRANAALAAVFTGAEGAEALLRAAQALVPVTAGLAVVNMPDAPPAYLADSYSSATAKAAVQHYVSSTYLLNPIWNAIREGLAPGIHRMADLAPDHWGLAAGESGVTPAKAEEIGYLTTGWPRGQAEVSILTALPEGAMAELSLARPSAEGGFSAEMIGILASMKPLIDAAQVALWARRAPVAPPPVARPLALFGRDRLSPREAEILQLVLKGHSNLSVSLALGITVPTVKTHRKNAYAKLGVSTQQELFHCFLTWAEKV